MAGAYDIYCDQGATFRRVITWKNGAGAVINLTGFSGRMMVRTSHGASAPTVSLTTSGGGGITLGGAAGTVTVVITATQTANIPIPTVAGVKDAFDGVYDLELVAPNGDVTRLLEGRFICSPEATR